MSKSRSTHIKKHTKNKGVLPLILKSEIEGVYKEYYATITGESGDCRFKFEEVNEGFTGVAKALKAVAKKSKFNIGDTILVQFDCNTNMYFVIRKYTPEHIRELKKGHHLDCANQEVSNVIIAGDAYDFGVDEPINIDDI